MGLVRAAYLIGGLAACALGVIGVFLPVLPTVPFLLLAAFCFARSNPAWEQRLYDHPRFGPALRHWRDRRAISRKAKRAALGAMALGAGLTWWTLGWPIAAGVTAILLVTASWIWTRNE